VNEGKEPRSKAPLVVFGGILLIALATVLAVVIGHCTREEPYLDPEEIRPGHPGRIYPPVEPGVSPPAPAPR
jgi:hypothetical protein